MPRKARVERNPSTARRYRGLIEGRGVRVRRGGVRSSVGVVFDRALRGGGEESMNALGALAMYGGRVVGDGVGGGDMYWAVQPSLLTKFQPSGWHLKRHPPEKGT